MSEAEINSAIQTVGRAAIESPPELAPPDHH